MAQHYCHYSSSLWLLVAIALYHVILLFSLYQVHYRVGHTPHATETHPLHSLPPPTHRVVLFVVDGLTANDVFSLNDREESRAPFLHHILHSEGRWGLVEDFVVKEPKVGHVAIASGFHEQAYLHGFDLIEHGDTFDSVLNASDHIWAWGDATLLPWLRSTLHEAEMMSVQYGNSNRWLFKSVEDFFHTSAGNASIVQQLARDKQIFYLHLTMHPNSNTSLLEMVAELDEGVGTIHEVVNTYYEDDRRTTFVLTSSCGQSHEQHGNLLPFVAWGAGVKSPRSASRAAHHHEDGLSRSWQLDGLERVDLEQVDIAPLLATLLGTRLPRHSTGQLPTGYIHYNKRFVAHGLLANAKQLMELSKIAEEAVSSSSLLPLSLYLEHPVSTLRDTLAQIENLIADHKLQESILIAGKLISKCSISLKELSSFHRKYHRVVLGIAMPTWILYLMLCLVTERYCSVSSSDPILYLTLPSLLGTLYIVFCLYSNIPLHYDLVLFCLSLSMLLGTAHKLVIVTKEVPEHLCRLLQSMLGSLVVVVVELLVQWYGGELGSMAGTILLVMWTYIGSTASPRALLTWTLMLLLNSLLLYFPTSKINYHFARVLAGGSTVLLHLFLYSCPSVKHLLSAPSCSPGWVGSTQLFATQLFVLVLATAATIVSQCQELLPYVVLSRSALLAFSGLVVFVGPLGVAGRLYHVGLLLFACFLQLDSGGQSAIFLLTCVSMATWIHIESRPCSANCAKTSSIWYGHLGLKTRDVLETCSGCEKLCPGILRRALIAVHLVMLYLSHQGVFDSSIHSIAHISQLYEPGDIVKVVLILVAVYTAFHVQNIHTRQCFKNSMAITAMTISFDTIILSQMFHVDGNWIQVRQSAFKFVVTILTALGSVLTVAFAHILTGSVITHKQQSSHAL